MRKLSYLALGLMVGSFACGGSDENQPPKTPGTPVATATATTTATAEQPKPVETPKPSMTPAQAMQKTLGEYGTAMQAKDAKKLAAMYTDNAKMMTVGMPDVVGRDAIQKSFEHEFTSMKDSQGMASRIWIKNDVAVVEWGMKGTPTGEMMGAKGNEKPVGVMGVSIQWYTPEGQIKEEHTYMDFGTIMSQMGVTKNKARAIPTITQNPPTIITSTGSGDEQKNVDTAMNMWNAFGKGTKGEGDFTAGMADDIQWDDMTQPDTMKGKDSGKKFFKMMTTAFPDLKVTPENKWGIADYVIVEGTMNGTQNGPLFGIAPTKKPVTMHGVDIMQMKDGKIVRGWSYANSAETMAQLGMMPKSKDAAKPADAKGTKETTVPTNPKK